MLGMDDDFKEHIIKEIVSASQNMFLLPALQIEAVLDEPTIRKRRKALQNMPRELYDVFGLTMDRIRAQKQSTSTVAMNVLQWIFLAARPLSLEELRHALAIEPGDTELHGDNFVEAQFILDSCLGLVIVDESTSTVRLVHKALQDYFQEMYDEGSLFQEGHMEIASICMTYMAFDHFNHEVCTLKDKIFDRYPLLGYAAVRWDYHLRSSKTRNIAVEDMAFTLVMEKYTSQLASKIFLTSRLEYSDYFFKMPEIQLRNYTKQLRYTESTTAAFPIHFAATTGSPDLFRRVIDSVKVDINEKDAWGNHLLTLTASMGHRSLVEIILDTRYNADVNAKTRDEALNILLRSSADPNLKDEMHGRTPLMWSFYDPWSRKQQKDYYNCDILKALLSHSDTNVNLKANDGSTALSRAIECELHEAEELLRAHGAV
ncbi:ankyrin repeat-containing domain protein [Pyronema omphalodes]|nr:ankyrin repeat-containing domain protein [Pyronema omphalodes]